MLNENRFLGTFRGHNTRTTVCPPKKGCIKKNATSEFPKKSTLQFLSIKDFRPLGIEIELLIDHITVVVLLNKCINFALCTRVCSNFDSCAILNSQAPKIFCP